MQNILRDIDYASMLAPVAAANTAAATTAWTAAKSKEGLIKVICFVGILDAGTLTWTFQDADNVGGDNPAAIVPVDGALTVVTTSNDNPNLQVAYFDARTVRSHIRAIGTMAGGAASALVAVMLSSVGKY